MKLSKRNIFIGVILLMLFTNPSRRYYLDSKLEDTVIVEKVAERICKTSSRDIFAFDRCKSEVVRNQSSIEQFLTNNYRRRNFFILSIHQLEMSESDSGTGDIRIRSSVIYEDIGILGIFINSVIILLLGLIIIFTGIAVLIVRFRKVVVPERRQDLE